MILKLFLLLTISPGYQVKHSFLYSPPNNAVKELHVLNLLEQGKITDKSHVFNSHELSISSIKHVIYPQQKREELMVELYANCGVVADSADYKFEDAEETIHYKSVDLILDNQGQIISTLPNFDENPCKPDSRVFNNKHVDMNAGGNFQVDFTFQKNLTPKVIQHVHDLTEKGKLEFEDTLLKTDYFEIESIEFNELSLQNIHGIGVNLRLLCDMSLKQLDLTFSPYMLKLFIYPNGEVSQLFGYYKGNIGKPCDLEKHRRMGSAHQLRKLRAAS